VTYSLIVDARVAQGDSLGKALEKTAEYAARTLKREETDEERKKLAIARKNAENLKKLAALGF